jgi:hypothetical protein
VLDASVEHHDNDRLDTICVREVLACLHTVEVVDEVAAPQLGCCNQPAGDAYTTAHVRCRQVAGCCGQCLAVQMVMHGLRTIMLDWRLKDHARCCNKACTS